MVDPTTIEIGEPLWHCVAARGATLTYVTAIPIQDKNINQWIVRVSGKAGLMMKNVLSDSLVRDPVLHMTWSRKIAGINRDRNLHHLADAPAGYPVYIDDPETRPSIARR